MFLQRRRALMLVCAATAMLCLLTAAPALAQTQLYVNGATGSDDGGANNCQSQASPCATITQAVSQAAAGDTINIGPGDYSEAVSTGLANLSLIGAGSSGQGDTVIDATGTGSPALSLSGTGEQVSDLALMTSDPSVAGALNVSGTATVTATYVAISTDSSTDGSDGIDDTGTSLTLSDSTIDVFNSDAAIQNTPSSNITVSDGSGIEINGGALSLDHSTIEVERGMALRDRANTASATVRDSVLESTGVEDYTSSEDDYAYDQWPVIEMAGGSFALHDSAVYNATVGATNSQTSNTSSTPTEYGPHTDALWVPDLSNVGAITIDNTILQAQPNSNPAGLGADIDSGEPLTITDSAYTTVATNGAGTGHVAAPGTAGNIVGDPGFNDPATADFSLAAGSALLGAGDVSDDQSGETDLDGNARTTACSGTPAAITNIGAFEVAAPACPVALSGGDSTGALTQLSGAGNCITGDTAAASGCGTASQPGMTGGSSDSSPTDVIQSPDGQNVYVATEDPSGTGVDVAELQRASDGSLSELPGANDCVEPTGGTGGCGTTDDQLVYQSGTSFAPTRMAISPHGDYVYVDNGGVIAEFSRDTTTGALAPLGSADCVDWIAEDGDCAYHDQEQTGPPAAMLVSPNGDYLYVATLNQCVMLTMARPGHAAEPLDDQNRPCANDQSEGTEASSDLAVFTIGAGTGVLAPGPCYDNSQTSQPTCDGDDASGNAFDGLYSMTSLAMSSDGKFLYVAADSGATESASTSDPFGLLSTDPGEVTTLATDPTTGALSQVTGAGACITAGIGCGGTDTGQNEVPGLADPQQIVLSPDGLNAYVVGAQYLPGSGANGPLVSTTLTQLARDPSTGMLTPISDAPCFAGWHEACGTAAGPGADVTQVPALTGAEALAISPDGQSVYVTAQAAGADSGVVEFSRDTDDGVLTPLSTPDLCLANGTAPGASSPYECATSRPAGVSSAVSALPGGVLVSPDCKTAVVMSDGLAEFSRTVPQNASGCLTSTGAGQPALSFSAASLSFAAAPSATSSAQSITVTNSGTGNLVFGSGALTLGGTDPQDFAITADGCSSRTLAPSDTCSFSVDFTAPGTGTFGADVELADNAAGSPQAFELRGSGVTAAISLSPASLSFGSTSDRIAVGHSDPETETIIDSGLAPLVLGALSVSGAGVFSTGKDGCSGTTLAPGGSCQVTVVYDPTQTGVDSGQLNIPDNAPGSPQSVTLSGAAGVPSLALSSTSLSFSDQSSDESLATLRVSDTSGDTELNVGAIKFSGPDASHFTEGDDCSAPITPGGSCAINIIFKADVIGTFTAQLSIADDASGSPQTVTLTGVDRYSIVGTVSDAASSQPTPLAGVKISVCPQSNIMPQGCPSVTTGADGSYSVRAIPGPTVLQVYAPSGLFGAQAVVQVVNDQTAVQNFDLTPPTPLSGGISIDGQTSGVPLIPTTGPINVEIPLQLPSSGPPDQTEIDAYITGLTGAGGSGGDSDTGVDIGMISMFGIHYGANGLPDAIGPSLSAQLDCSGSPSPCAGPLSPTAPSGGGSSASDTRALRRAVDPIAYAARCPTLNMKISPGDLNVIPGANSVHFIMDFGPANGQWDLGTYSTYQPWNFAPAPSDPDLPIASYVVALPGKAVNGAINAPFAVWNAWVTNTQELATAERVDDPALAQEINHDAYIDMSVQTLEGAYHGDSQVVQKGFTLLDKANSYNTTTLTQLVAGVYDCPPKQASVYIDPSGTVKSTAGVPVAGAKVTLTRSATAKGKQRQVPNGSKIMDPSNRRNPDHTNALGAFQWDVVPGFYRIEASHRDCRASTGDAAFGLTPVLAIPPPRANLAIALRCHGLTRNATRVILRVASKGRIGGLVEAQVVLARGGRKVPADRFGGEVTFALRKRHPVTVPLEAKQRFAVFDLPVVKGALGRLSATFSGDGYLAPSRAVLNHP